MTSAKVAHDEQALIRTLTRSKYYPWLVWGLGAFFFFVEYFARVAPNVMAADLMATFHVNALALGGLSASFYCAYIGMQLPVGSLMDRYGPRMLLTVTGLLCALGCYLFAHAATVHEAVLGRFLLGFGSAFAFVGALTLAAAWFPAHKIGLLAGLTQALGMLGAAVGEAPMAYLDTHLGWRITSVLISFIFVVMSVMVGLLVRDKPRHHAGPAQQQHLLAGLKIVLTHPASWMNAVFAGLLYAPTAVLGELWGVSALQEMHQLSRPLAASVIGLIFIGWAVGGPLIGWLSDHLRRRRVVMFGSALASLIFLLPLLYAQQLSIPALACCSFCFGMCNTGVAISYAVATELHSRQIVATSLAFANMVSIAVGACFHPLVGWLLDYHAAGTDVAAISYHATDFSWALLSLPLVLLLALTCSFFVPETRCQPCTAAD